jgi:hypothetical protein
MVSPLILSPEPVHRVQGSRASPTHGVMADGWDSNVPRLGLQCLRSNLHPLQRSKNLTLELVFQPHCPNLSYISPQRLARALMADPCNHQTASLHPLPRQKLFSCRHSSVPAPSAVNTVNDVSYHAIIGDLKWGDEDAQCRRVFQRRSQGFSP